MSLSNIRSFAFVVFNDSDEIIDRYNLDLVTNITGLGYRLKISTISTDVEDYVTKVIQEKKTLNLQVIHRTRYSGGNSLVAWLQANNDKTLCLEYNDTTQVLYLECKVEEISKTEVDDYGVLRQDLTIKPLTPFFERIENDVRIEVSASGKSYNFKYPYTYGKNIVTNNEIENVYIKDIPLIVTIHGAISNPIITLKDSDTNETYNEVRFLDVDLQEGQKIIINSAQKKILFDDGSGNLVDYYYKLDGSYDSYLRAEPLITSKITINLGSGDTGYLVGSRRQYKL